MSASCSFGRNDASLEYLKVIFRNRPTLTLAVYSVFIDKGPLWSFCTHCLWFYVYFVGSGVWHYYLYLVSFLYITALLYLSEINVGKMQLNIKNHVGVWLGLGTLYIYSQNHIIYTYVGILIYIYAYMLILCIYVYVYLYLWHSYKHTYGDFLKYLFVEFPPFSFIFPQCSMPSAFQSIQKLISKYT